MRLAVGDWSETRSFEVAADPRLPTTREELEDQLRLGLEVRDRIDELYGDVRRIRSVREQALDTAARLEDAGRGGDEVRAAAEALRETLDAIEEKLVQTKNESSQDPLNFPPKLSEQYVALYSEIVGSFFGPTDAARERLTDLDGERAPIRAQLEEAVRSDVAAFNELAASAGASAVVVP